MFEDSLLESGGRLARRNPWTVAASFAGEIALAGILVLLSLFYTEALPAQRFMNMLQAPAPPQALAATHTVEHLMKSPSAFVHGVLTMPREIPKTIGTVRDEAPQGDSPAFDGVTGSIPGGTVDGRLGDVLRITVVNLPKIATQKVRVSSGVAQGLLIRQVSPRYPELARQARIQGTVTLAAVIGKDGMVQNLRVISGHPLLTNAAMDAVKQWLYKPYLLNGEPVEVDTQINVNFVLE